MGFMAAAAATFTLFSGSSAASDQKRVDKESAWLTFQDNMEKIRRRKFTQEQTLGATKALSETAGVLHTKGSTPEQYIGAMAESFKKELDWMKEYAHKAKALGFKGADIRSRAATNRAIGSAISTGASVYGMGG